MSATNYASLITLFEKNCSECRKEQQQSPEQHGRSEFKAKTKKRRIQNTEKGEKKKVSIS